MNDDEWSIKRDRLAEFLDQHHFDGVLLTLRSNFAWATGGKDNRIANNTPVGVASILATKDGKRVCIANNIESPRIKAQELADLDIETINFPWYDGAAGQKVVRDVIAGRKIACDSEAFGLHLPLVPGSFNALRWELTPAEIDRIREGGRRGSRAMESACRSLKRGMTEQEIAGVLDHEVHRAGLNPLVTLVTGDDRIKQFRHPIPKPIACNELVMLVTCAEYAGLIACLTRFVAFVEPTKEQRDKCQAVANIDAAVNLATKPGRTLGEIFDDLRRAYAENGHADQWQNHHQGGSTGYLPREMVATPGSPMPALANQAFAWNPSIVGAKSEDTVLCTENGIEVLTGASNDWPGIEGKSSAGTLRRAGWLIA
jgi:Xaa-Pro aminopeptidase